MLKRCLNPPQRLDNSSTLLIIFEELICSSAILAKMFRGFSKSIERL
ncbi:MAG: hypothetical protein QW552_06320 [Ignisphaera sp.]